ncbi:MAG: hypothetical protein ACTHJL_00345 [Amnibacterium sp.]
MSVQTELVAALSTFTTRLDEVNAGFAGRASDDVQAVTEHLQQQVALLIDFSAALCNAIGDLAGEVDELEPTV